MPAIRSKEAVAPDHGPEERLREHLKARNLRMTPERLMVLQGAMSQSGHFDADELLESLRRSNREVSRATLYRTLDHLAEAGLVKRHHFGEGHARFESVFDRAHHDHMVCHRCGAVIEFVSEEIETLQDQICEQHGFLALGHVHQIFGICRNCQTERT